MLVKLVDRLGQGSRVSHECPTENKGMISGARHTTGRPSLIIHISLETGRIGCAKSMSGLDWEYELWAKP
jgi:hypothetical protein